MTNYECEAMPSASTQEEADTLMIHHAVEVASNRMNVHICSQDTAYMTRLVRRNLEL